ncbi:hypothetical protein F0L68_05020 [Solihabitans fulvus]|uniref:Acyl-homoserine-lactone acylase n=1 Tax=Solihabitans fulvus TaxID=1892852 RepID=A0A5B2XQQ3_9PSEU|nr:penicillin acylase family protein [Solihabitans fulvus]KAA2265212.1 hypothetical protein F0L68_05020 [Solihabitans fulvus]
MRSRHRTWTLAVAGALALAGIGAAAPASAAPSDQELVAEQGNGHYRAEVRRTEYGIPHVLAHDFGGLGFGYGHAFAQDNLCVLADRVLTLRGERSAAFGPTADSGDALARPTTNLASDTYYQGLRRSGVVERLLARPAPLGPTAQVRQLVDGYVAGYNRYLRDTGVARLPDPTCRGAAWVTPITALDVWSAVYDINRLNGTANFKAAIADAGPPAPGAAAAKSGPDFPSAPEDRADGIGSNGWAIGRDATAAHDGMVLANPHFPWSGIGRFYQVQLTIPGVMDVSGASLYGTPVVEIGHTGGVAWTHTVSTAQRATLFQLALVPGDPTSYLVDGRPEAMTRQTVPVTVRAADGTVSTVQRTTYSSRYGPVLATGWTATAAFAIADANANNLRSMNEWLAMDQAQHLDQLLAAQRTFQGIPFTNTIASETGGTAYLADASVVPHVTDADAARCVDTPQGKAAYPHTIILDGAASNCGWGSDPDAIEPGIFGPHAYPALTRNDFAANSNESPWLANPAAPITGYPAIFGDTGTPRGLRPQLGQDMIAARIAGTDGYGAPGFTMASLRDTMLGDRNRSADIGRADIVAMCQANPSLPARDGTQVDVRSACDTLAAWDARDNADSRGAVLWREFFWRLFDDDAPGGWWRVPPDPAQPLTTPRGIDGSRQGVQHALADTVQFFQANHIPVDEALGDAQRYATVPLPGCLGPEGCFNVVSSNPPLGADGRYADLTQGHGSSFIMAVELTRDGPRTSTLLTYSESANPDSPHHTDQTVLFSHRQWVTERFTEAEINADPHLHRTVLRG